MHMDYISQNNSQSEPQNWQIKTDKNDSDQKLTGDELDSPNQKAWNKDKQNESNQLFRQMLGQQQPKKYENSEVYANVGNDLNSQQYQKHQQSQQHEQQQSQKKCQYQQKGDQNYKRIQPIRKQIQKKEKNKKLHKNNNVIKHFLKSFIFKCLLKRYIGHFDGFPEVFKQVSSFIKDEKKMYNNNRNWNINLEAMRKVFAVNHACSQFAVKRSRILRKIAHEMIRQQIIPQVLTNNQIKDMAYSYIYSLIFMMHRCMNPELMARSQII